MKAYSLIVIFICCVCRYTSVDIMPELKRNILNFGYGINFKYDRFYVVTKLILPTINDLNFFPIDFDSECSYLNVNINRHTYPMQYLPKIKTFCENIVTSIDFYKKQIDYYNKRVHEILRRDSFDTPKFPKKQKRKERYNYYISTQHYWIGL